MIKLETKTAALPQVVALLVIQSASAVPAVALSVAKVNEKDERTGDWVESVANMRQTVAGYLDGKPFAMAGKVNHLDAVEVATCFKAVVQIEVKTVLTTAYEKGDKSREICQVSLVKVVEVWESPTKCLWRASDGGNGASQQAAQFDPATGRIAKPETAGRS